MMRKGKTKGSTVYFVVAAFVACYLAETAECYRRRKPLRLDVRKGAESTKSVGVYEGEILFGVSLKGPESQLMNGTNQPSSNASLEDEAGYQADFPVLPYYPAHMDAWNQMTKSLQCGADHMDFKVVGSGIQHFAVDQLNGPSLPLPLVPPSCGYNMRRLPFSLHLSLPYSACHVLNKGGRYMLPLTWRGNPIVLSCQTPTTPSPKWLPWPHTYPLPPCPWHPLPGQTTTCQPTTSTQGPVAWPMPHWPIGHHPGVGPWDPWPDHPTTAAPTKMPQIHWPYPLSWYHKHLHYYKYPYYNYHKYPYYPYIYHKHPHYHDPYWLDAQEPTPDTPPTTTAMPYIPVHDLPYVPDQRSVSISK